MAHTSADEIDPGTLASTTLALLETRLRRLEFLLGDPFGLDNGLPRSRDAGSNDRAKHTTVPARIQHLGERLDALKKSSTPVGELIRSVDSLHARVPELFNQSSAQSRPAPASVSVCSSIVLAHATVYPEHLSRLSSLSSLPVPSTTQSAELANLQPRLDAARQRQERLQREAELLRERSARCLEWWVRVGIVGMGELWNDWEQRVREVERGVHRMQNRRQDEEGYV